MAQSRVFGPITRKNFERIKVELEQRGVTLSGDSGVHEAHGVRMSFAYDESRRSLSVSLHRKPMLLPSTVIWNRLEAAVQPFLHQSQGEDADMDVTKSV
jgi:hypothetical protein